MRLNPRIEEPSNISSLSRAFSSSAAGIEMFFNWPYSSVNCRRMNLTSFSRQRSISSRLSTWCPPRGVNVRGGNLPRRNLVCTSPRRDTARAHIAAHLGQVYFTSPDDGRRVGDRDHPLDAEHAAVDHEHRERAAA